MPEPNEMLTTRRKLLTRVSIALGAFGAALVGLPVVGFLLEPLLKRAGREWRNVGEAGSFSKGQTVEVSFEDSSSVPWAGVTGKTAAWLRHGTDGEFTAFSINCSHLGCPVRWLPEADLFMCPCHGGVYYSDGTVAAGPPPKPLTKYPVRVENGIVQILTSPTPIS